MKRLKQKIVKGWIAYDEKHPEYDREIFRLGRNEKKG